MNTCRQLLLILVIAWAHQSHGARILVTTVPQGVSHVLTMTPLLTKLASQGHEVVSYVDVYGEKIPVGQGVQDYQVVIKSSPDAVTTKQSAFLDVLWNGDFGQIWGWLMPWFNSIKTCDRLLRNQPDEFWHIANQTWDLIIVDSLFAPCGQALGRMQHKRGVPYVMYHISAMEPQIAYFKSLGWSAASRPQTFLPVADPEWHVDRFAYRLRGFIGQLESVLLYALPVQMKVRAVTHSIYPDGFTWHDFVSDASFNIYDYPERHDFAVAQSKEMVSVGANCKPAAPLEPDWEAFVNDPSSNGTIMIAFGTAIRWHQAPDRLMRPFMETLRRLSDYRILWSYKGDHPDMPPHVKFSGWIPQYDLLHHPRTKAFISHGGMKSVKETICGGTPAVYIPMFAEHCKNSFIAKRHGFGEQLNKLNVVPDEWEAKIRRVASTPSYRTQAKRARQQWMDRVINPVDEGAFWVNKVLKHNGLPSFFYRSVSRLAWYQYWCFDQLSLVAMIAFFVSK